MCILWKQVCYNSCHLFSLEFLEQSRLRTLAQWANFCIFSPEHYCQLPFLYTSIVLKTKRHFCTSENVFLIFWWPFQIYMECILWHFSEYISEAMRKNLFLKIHLFFSCIQQSENQNKSHIMGHMQFNITSVDRNG